MSENILKGPGGRLLVHCTLGVDKFLYATLTSVWMFPVAFFLTLQVHLPGFRSKTLRILGVCIIVLQIYYCQFFGSEPNLANRYSFSLSCLYLFFDEVFVRYLMQERFKEVMSWAELRCFRNFVKINPDVQGHYEFFRKHARERLDDMAWNVYMDIRKPLRRAVMFWIVQVGLFMYYLFELNGLSPDKDSPGVDAHYPKNVSMVKFMLAVFLLMVARDDQAGPSFDGAFWMDKMRKVTRSNGDHNIGTLFFRLCSRFYDNEDGDRACLCFGMPPSVHILIRMFFDFFVNVVVHAIICGTAPIMLCVEGPLDFVKDATAVFFIIRLDDVGQPMNLSESESWNPLSTEASYDLSSINDLGYSVDGLRKLLEYPSLDDVHRDAEKMLLEVEKTVEEKAEKKYEKSSYQPPKVQQRAWLQPWTPSLYDITLQKPEKPQQLHDPLNF